MSYDYLCIVDYINAIYFYLDKTTKNNLNKYI